MRFQLNAEEQKHVTELLDRVRSHFQSAEEDGFLAEAAVWAHQLPVRLRRALHKFRLSEPSTALCVVSGYPIRDEQIGPTPAHWKERQQNCVPVREEMYLVLVGSLLGEPIAWSTQQDGAVVHDIAPIKGHQGEQLGSGSKEELTWHTEDAFHPFRGDYLGMMCMRNPDRIPTTFAPIDISELDEETLGLLFEPHYTIRPDESHLRKNRVAETNGDQFLEAAHDRIDEMNTRPEKIPVLFGNRERPYCRLDPYFMDPPANEGARRALDKLTALIDEKLEDLVLQPGDVCFIDNFQAVHGRRAFKARFDGTDRWLKRINVTRDLRRSRIARRTAESRVLF